jgi:hypothetical protein
VSRRRPDAPLPWEQPRADLEARRERRRRRAGWVAYAVILVAALASVVWRQTVGGERFHALEQARLDLGAARAERDEALARVLQAQRRELIVAYAQQRLGMHVARDEEIVLLRVPASAAPRADSVAEARP